MLRRRLIPVLLVEARRLVKTRSFKGRRYVGDPINVVRIFNDKEVDEIVILDIGATALSRGPDLEFISQLAGEAFMPLCYGGGVRSVDTMRALFRIGIEKVALNTAAIEMPDLVHDATRVFGRQSVVVSIDAKRGLLGRYEARTHGGRTRTGLDPVSVAKQMAEAGAGELLVNSIDRDGTRAGYDLDLLRRMVAAVEVPVVVCGGADGEKDFLAAWSEGAGGCGAGSAFIFQPRTGAVLVTYPRVPQELQP
jgi:cyclase